jgi:hypothetical protein
MKRHGKSTLLLLVLVTTIIFVPFLPTATASEVLISEEEIEAAATITDGANLINTPGLLGNGYNGTDTIIAILDTGIDASHPDLVHGLNSTSCLITENRSFVPGEDANDYDGHGTFIAGILIGNGDSSAGMHVGMAPSTEIWNLKVLNHNGEGEESWVVNAMNWILGSPEKPDIVSLSFGAGTPLVSVETKVKELWNAGIVVVAAAGNEGPEYYTVDSPGSVLDAITVGACSLDEYLMAFSSEGPTNGTYYYKPDLVALGTEVISLKIGGGYTTGHGTSFSVPFIAGGAALLIDALNGSTSPDELKAAILESCKALGYSYFMDGAGLPNFTLALEFLKNGGWDGFYVLPGDVEFPIKERDGTTTNLLRYRIKLTAINSRYSENIIIDLAGDLAGHMVCTLEEYEGGKDQFAIVIDVNPSFAGGKEGTVIIKTTTGIILGIVTARVVGEAVPLAAWIILGVIGVVVTVMVIFFAAAYRRGVKSLPRRECELDGSCPEMLVMSPEM